VRVGLVLGGGGVIGVAYHAAALAALENDLGWDPRTAEVIVGTSAGSVVGSMLRRGVPASDLAAITVGATPLEITPEMAERLGERTVFPTMGVRSFLRRPRLPNVSLFTSWVRRPWRMDPLGAIMSILPDGSLDLAEYTEHLRDVLADDWPDQALWITAVRQDDLRRAVFGRDLWPALGDAVYASCAIPGYFRPITIDGHRYVDGGVRSPTNADVLRRRPDLDLVIVVSPMSGRELGRLGSEAAVRRHAKGRLERETKRLLDAGIPVVAIEPGPEVIETLGLDFMNHDRVEDITRAAILDTGEQIAEPFVRTLLAGLSTRRARPAPDRPAEGPGTAGHASDDQPADRAG
jgi:NTE family protein